MFPKFSRSYIVSDRSNNLLFCNCKLTIFAYFESYQVVTDKLKGRNTDTDIVHYALL